MTGNQDRDSVCSVRMPDGALPGGRTNAPRQLFVRTRLSIRYTEEFVPHPQLKRRPWINERNRKLPQLAGEIPVEFLPQFRQVLIFTGHNRTRKELLQCRELRLQHAAVCKFEKAYSVLVRGSDNRSQRTF